MREEQLASIRAKCIEANPDAWRCKCHDLCGYWSNRSAHLADVLLAIPHLKPLDDRNIVRGQAESSGNAGFIETVSRWNLRADNLDQQSNETISFIHSLLSV